MAAMNEWRILVVEDEPDGQMVVSGILNYFNVAVDAVADAEQALNALKSTKYTGAVIDLALPGMDGVSLMKNIRNNPNPQMQKLPCVAITAFHTSAVKQQAIDAGFDAYFPKPIDDTTFIRELSRVIEEV
jgi:CheY-like chemotaxis protein